MKIGETVHSEDVADSAEVTEDGQCCLRVLTWLHAFTHSQDDVRFCPELVFDTRMGSHCNSECDIPMDCFGDRGQRANFVDFPVSKSCVQV